MAVFLAAGLTVGAAGCGAAPGDGADQDVPAVSGEATPASATDKQVTIEDEGIPKDSKPVLTHVLTPQASGSVTYTADTATIDASNVSQGYVMVKYNQSGQKIKVQITRKGAATYTYNLNSQGQYEVFPLTEGDGTYTVNVYENVQGDKYALVLGKDIAVTLKNNFTPFLYPNQYVTFTDGSKCVALAAQLAQKAENDLETVQLVYDYVVNNVTYDKQAAETVQSGYLPNPDTTLSTKKGICFDYAALMTAMLRSQSIPAKLVVGYTGNLYHAWINVYTPETGWVDNLIYFDGKDWKLMDPTFASSGKGDPSIQKYIGDGANYKAKYTY